MQHFRLQYIALQIVIPFIDLLYIQITIVIITFYEFTTIVIQYHVEKITLVMQILLMMYLSIYFRMYRIDFKRNTNIGFPFHFLRTLQSTSLLSIRSRPEKLLRSHPIISVSSKFTSIRCLSMKFQIRPMSIYLTNYLVSF